jgi:dTMP kinase
MTTQALFSEAPTAPGLFVTIDGPNGSGKTSLAAEAAAALTERGYAVHRTKQPSPTPLGDSVRAAERSISGRALGCLVAADRHHQVQHEIRPALERGDIVLCDRYIESSLVLQRIDDVEIEYILAINASILRPDLRIRLIASEDVLRRRLAGRPVDPSRRFELDADGPLRELRLYEEADELLTSRFGLTSDVYDTSTTLAPALGQQMAEAIERRRT